MSEGAIAVRTNLPKATVHRFYDANGGVAAALSIAGPTARMTKMHLSRELQPKVCRTAMDISPQRGHRGGSR